MLNVRAASIDPKAVKALAFTAGMFTLTWLVAGWVIEGSSLYLVLLGVGGIGLMVFMSIMKDWRMGVYIFLSWLVLEDQIRKYLGNSTFMFFAKDAIIGLTYIAMMVAYRRRQLLTFRPPFMIFLGIFFWMAAMQVLNPNSPSIFFGILGMKTYFYYIPLMFAGYAMLRNEEDLHKILMLNMWIGLIVSGFGLLQSFGGGGFLTPDNIDPALYTLSHVMRSTGESGSEFVRSTSVFVSDGRYGHFLVLFFILAVGTAGYIMLRKGHGQYVVFTVIAVVSLATIMTGSRGSFVYLILDTIVLSVALLWGAPWRFRLAFRLGKVVRNVVILSSLAIAIAMFLSPDAIQRRLNFYFYSLSPTSSHSELRYRSFEYPTENFEAVFLQPNWQWGNGTGVASLGTQYVVRAFGVPPPNLGVESGYGSLISEFGVIGPILWIIWTVSLVLSSWKVVKKLKQTQFFPIGFAIFWFAFMVLIPFTFQVLNGYQNYLTCAYLWLTVGILYRLPALLAEQQAAAALRNAPVQP